MTHQWDECLDSEGDGPIEREVDTKVFIDRYLPDPDTLPPRRFRVVTLGGLQTSNPQYIWLDAYMREVDPPPTTEEPSSSAEN